VHGDLAFDDVGIELHVYESLRGLAALSSTTCGGPMQWATEPVVYGRLRTGEEVILLEVSGLATGLPRRLGGYLRAQLLFEHDSSMPAGQIRAA
jgi:hypothetical protein